MSERQERIVFTAPPLTFNYAGALAYTGFGEKLFRQLERAKSISSKPIGQRGEKMYYRPQLDEVAAKVFGNATSSIDDEFDIDDD